MEMFEGMGTSIAMVVCGFLTHYLMEFADQRTKSVEFNVLTYIKTRPYKTMLSVIGAVVGTILLKESGQLTLLTAYGVGYMCDSGAQRFGNIASAAVEKK